MFVVYGLYSKFVVDFCFWGKKLCEMCLLLCTHMCESQKTTWHCTKSPRSFCIVAPGDRASLSLGRKKTCI